MTALAAPRFRLSSAFCLFGVHDLDQITGDGDAPGTVEKITFCRECGLVKRKEQFDA